MPTPLRTLLAAFAAWRWEIQATPEAAVRAYWKYASTMDRYRIYHVHRGAQVVILLCGGTSARNGGTSNGLRSWRRHCDSAPICPKLLIRTRPPNHRYTRRTLTSSAPPTCRNLHSLFLPHRVPAAPRAHYLSTRFRAVALFGRRSPERVVRSSSPAAENLAQ
jgi:hypothetical protein